MNMHSYQELKRCTCRPANAIAVAKTNPAVAKQLKIVAVPSKLRILQLLKFASHCVCDLMVHTKISQTLLSHHLADLSAIGLVNKKKNGAFVDYSLTDRGLKLVNVVSALTI